MPLSRLVVCILSESTYSDGRTTTATQDGVVIADTSIKNRIVIVVGAAIEDGDILYLFGVEWRIYVREYAVPTCRYCVESWYLVPDPCAYCKDCGWWMIKR